MRRLRANDEDYTCKDESSHCSTMLAINPLPPITTSSWSNVNGLRVFGLDWGRDVLDAVTISSEKTIQAG
jgi:hypothetical protein